MFFASDKDFRKGLPKKAPTRAAKAGAGGATLSAASAGTSSGGVEDVVKKAKIEREERMHKRELVASAVKIQTWWRRVSSAARSIADFLAQYRSKMADVDKLNKVLVAKGLPGLVAPCTVVAQVMKMLQHIIRFSRRNYTAELASFCQLLLNPVLSQLDPLKNIMAVEHKRDKQLTSLCHIFDAVVTALVAIVAVDKRASVFAAPAAQSANATAHVEVLSDTLTLLLGQSESYKLKHAADLAAAFVAFREQLGKSTSLLVRVRDCLLRCSAPLLVNKLSDEVGSAKSSESVKVAPEVLRLGDRLFQLALWVLSVETKHTERLLDQFVSTILSVPLLTCIVSRTSMRRFVCGDLFASVLPRLAVPDLIDFSVAQRFSHVITCHQWTLGNLLSLAAQLTIAPPTSGAGTASPTEESADVVSDMLLETYLNVCSLWLVEYSLADVLQGREGIVWRKVGASLTAVAVPVALESQMMTLLDVEVLRALCTRIVAPCDLQWEDFVLTKDAAEIEEALSGSAFTATRNALLDQQQASTWFTSKWAQKMTKSVKRSVTSMIPSIWTTGSSSSGSGAAVASSSSSSGGGGLFGSNSKLPASTNRSLFLALTGVWAPLLAQISSAAGGADSQPRKALNFLAFSSQCVDKLWLSLLREVGTIDVVKVFSKLECDLEEPNNVFTSLNTEFNLMMCVVSLLKTVLIALDDSELYEQQKPMPLPHILQLVRSLKIVLFKLVALEPKLLLDQSQIDEFAAQAADGASSASGGAKSPGANEERFNKNVLAYRAACAKNIASVLTDLYARWARRPFSAAALWEIEDTSSRDIRAEIKVGTPLGTALLRSMPWSIDYHERMKIFRELCDKERLDIQGSNDLMMGGEGFRSRGQVIRIRKRYLLEDGMEALTQIGGAIKDRVVVRYVNEFGEDEAGIDIGGLFKDFVTDLSSRIFDPSYGLFCLTSSNLLYPNPAAPMLYERHELDKMYVFLGRVLGKAMFENITLQPQFAHFFLAFMHGRYNFMRLIDDLVTLDPELYKNLMFLKSYEGDIADLSLTFSITDISMGLNREVELIPGGSNVGVTATNRYRYVNLVAKYYLHDRLRAQAGAFFSGLYQVISPLHLGIFCAPELQILISGSHSGIEVADLRANSRYNGGYVISGQHIHWFWEVVEEMAPADRALLVRFVTSCERPPSLGFAALQPPFTIQRVGVEDDSRLPSASTCFNILKLPTYSSKAIMRDKLLLAIRSKSGFDLS